jgi:hypothetical protein
MKCGIRAEGITNDDEHKIFYAAVERYFSDTYGIRIDPACKDIARLTFVSSDPNTFINPNPSIFDVAAWAKKPVERFYNPPETNNGWRNGYGQKVLESCCRGIAESVRGQQHNIRLRKAKLVGGFIASGFIDEAVALAELESAVITSGAVRVGDAMKTILDGIRFGKDKPISPENRPVDVRKKDDISYYCDVDEVDHDDQDVSNVSNVSNVQDCNAMSSNVSGCKQDVSRCKQDYFSPICENDPKKPANLAAHIVEWIKDSPGSFTVDQIDK